MSNYTKVYTANGQLQAETIRIFLESFGIDARILQESAGAVYGLTVGPMGETQVIVPEEQAQNALELLAEMEKGDFEIKDDPDTFKDGFEEEPREEY
jgi:hypothetical protein